jgi:hypothetical protein
LRKLGGFVFHNTCYTAVTDLVAAGVPDGVAMTISGRGSAAEPPLGATAIARPLTACRDGGLVLRRGAQRESRPAHVLQVWSVTDWRVDAEEPRR